MQAFSASLDRVFVVGGTHGNEAIGVQLAKHYERSLLDLNTGRNFETSVLLANTNAIALNRRYQDTDLNRCFLLKDLDAPVNDDTAPWEYRRAKEINQLLGPKQAPPHERHAKLVIDLHTTTSNTKILLLMHNEDVISHAIAAHLMAIDADVRVCEWLVGDEPPFLPTTGASGLTFEIGPVPNGCVHGGLFRQSDRLLHATFDFVHDHNARVASGELIYDAKMIDLKDANHERELRDNGTLIAQIDVFQKVGSLDYPRFDDGQLAGMIHPTLQAKAELVEPLSDGFPIFMGFDGHEVTFDNTYGEEVYPFFINEAAYYEKRVGFVLARKVRRAIVRV